MSDSIRQPTWVAFLRSYALRPRLGLSLADYTHQPLQTPEELLALPTKVLCLIQIAFSGLFFCEFATAFVQIDPIRSPYAHRAVRETICHLAIGPCHPYDPAGLKDPILSRKLCAQALFAFRRKMSVRSWIPPENMTELSSYINTFLVFSPVCPVYSPDGHGESPLRTTTRRAFARELRDLK